MTTFAGLVEETLGLLRAYSTDQERKSSLLSGIDASTTDIPVTDTDKVSESLIEVDEELIEIASVDQLAGTATAFPWGRGQGGTTAASHLTGARVIISPRWPRFTVKQRVNQAIAAVWPDLFAVATDTSQLTSATQVTYTLPATARGVLDIRWQTDGGSPDYWARVHTWRMDPSADTVLYPTGVTVDIGESMSTGRTLKIVYKKEPTPLVNDSDEFATVTGLPESASDLVCMAAAARLIVSAELVRSQSFTIEHSERVADQASGSTVAASKYLMQLYQVRLAAERDRQFERYGIQLVRTWT
jgi:hypothetical protein